MKTLLKKARKIWARIRPVHCRRCGELLTQKQSRARGVSSHCRKLEIEEKARQVKETEQYFFTKPGIEDVSPMFLNMGDLLKHPQYTASCHIWKGYPDAAILVELSETGK